MARNYRKRLNNCIALVLAVIAVLASAGSAGAVASAQQGTLVAAALPAVAARSTLPATACVTGAARPVIGTRGPTLAATISGSSSVTATFEWWVVGATAPMGSYAMPSPLGTHVSVGLARDTFSHGGAYAWRVRAIDSATASAWSGFCEFSVDVGAAAVAGCSATGDGDFNGDGQRDMAIADPNATVAGSARAGAIYVEYGGTGNVTTLDENLPEVPGNAETAARFGYSLAVYDANADGCADLAVGLPYKYSGTTEETGVVYLLYGSPAGLGKGPAATVLAQGAGTVPGVARAYDWFGYALAAGQTSHGEPFLIVGAPGDDVGSANDAGTTTYLRGDAKLALDQSFMANSSPEADDRGGFALAATPVHFAIGFPGENGGPGTAFAGAVCVLNHVVAAGKPGVIGCVNQDSAGVSNAMEAGDQFGKSIALAPFWPTGDSLLAVGVPGEGLSSPDIADCGLVMQFRVSANGITQVAEISQSTPGISGGNEPGDLFGEKVLLINLQPGNQPTAATLLLAVGSPGEDLGDVAPAIDAGGIHVFAAGTATISIEAAINRDPSGLPGSPLEQEFLGMTFGLTSADLLVSSPYGSAKAVYALHWPDLAAGNVIVARTWQPGVGGFPATAVSFGTEVR